jgi:hypothetical protein
MPKCPIWIDVADLETVSGYLAQLLKEEVIPYSPFLEMYEQVVEIITN